MLSLTIFDVVRSVSAANTAKVAALPARLARAEQAHEQVPAACHNDRTGQASAA